tara:strand:+ start:233 stop:844 length:612 start_codon:yes stop_codon:yes gene_type:complete
MTTFAIIDARDITELGKHKASGCAWALYTALMTFARGTKASCFPSIKTLSELIGGNYSEAGIFKALKWLEDKKFIKRNEKRSKQRFVMLRKFVNAISTKVEKALHTTKVENKNKLKNTSFLRRERQKKSRFRSFQKPKQKRSYGDFFFGSKQAEDERKCEAETIFEMFVINNPTRDVSKLSKADLSVIIRCLNSQAPHDVEWR